MEPAPSTGRWSFDEVLLIRHGETEWNVAGRRQGQLDSPLTANGQQQAEAMATHSCLVGSDAIFASPLGRAKSTAEPIATRLDRPVNLLSDLGEIDHGAFAGLTSTEIEQRWPGSLQQRERDKYDWRFPGGESYRDADARIARALDKIAAVGPKRPTIVAHAMVGRMLIGRLLGLSPAEALQRTLRHATVLQIDPNRSKIESHTVPDKIEP